jgi:hypothetical protein
MRVDGGSGDDTVNLYKATGASIGIRGATGVGKVVINASNSVSPDMGFVTNSLQRVTILFNGNTLFGTTVDNGSLVQVNGNLTALPATLSNQVVVKSQLDEVAPIKTYKAIIAQTSTGAPTVIRTFKNTFGTWSISRSAVGSYNFIISGAFPTGYGEVTLTNGYNALAGSVVANVASSGTVSIFTYNAAGALADGILNNCTLIINRWE